MGPHLDHSSNEGCSLKKRKTSLAKEDISCIQDELKIPLETKTVANHALHVNLLGFTKGKTKRSSYLKFGRAFVRDVQANLPEG